MKRLLPFLLSCFFTWAAAAQPSLQFFTNEASAFLKAQFGFTTTNIPAAAYSSAVHYWLQAAANDYDLTTPATNLPSVFRPLFSWQGSNLLITGYTSVTNDCLTQINHGFKVITDPTITTNDNVWGIPWVVGMKGHAPAFNGYCYSAQFGCARDLVFVEPIPDRPPVYTNQFLIMWMSNIFGFQAWNYSETLYTNSVTLIASNQIFIELTNEFGGGTNFAYTFTTNDVITNWYADRMLAPLTESVVGLPFSFWSDVDQKFDDLVALSNDETDIFSDNVPPNFRQTGWPVYHWTLSITNYLSYCLVDNASGQLLDFVNLGGFGSAIDIAQTLQETDTNVPSSQDMWAISPATDLPRSPMSGGMVREIEDAELNDPTFMSSLMGHALTNLFGPGIFPEGVIQQSFIYKPADPLVHYTLGDLALIPTNVSVAVSENLLLFLPLNTDIGIISPFYDSGAIHSAAISLLTNAPYIDFIGAFDLPYQVWASTDFSNWIEIGTASPSASGQFSFSDPSATNYPARFYQIRLP